MQRDIPGFYYDAEKKRYFKIEKSATAPSSAAWSSDAVRKRKAEDAAAGENRRRERLLQRHVRRSGLWAAAPVSTALLRRETGDLGGRMTGRGLFEEVLGPAAWAGGIVGRGVVRFHPEERGSVPCFWVGGEEDGLRTGTVYTAVDESVLAGSYIVTDAHGSIETDPGVLAEHPKHGVFREPLRCEHMSAIKYHAPSHRMIVTSGQAASTCGVTVFSPSKTLHGADWHLGRTDVYERWALRQQGGRECIVHNCAPAPASSNTTICALATSNGIMRVMRGAIKPLTARGRGARPPREIFDLTFHANHPQLLLAGGRDGRVLHADLRTEAVDWSWFPSRSTVARLADVGPHGVLVCGLRNSMALYDLRFTKKRRKSGVVDPVISFAAHRNAAHWQIGFDVCEKLGVVAAAQDDGRVKLFNLRSGAVLPSPGLDSVVMDSGPVKALMFKTVPGEKGPSLFIGEGLGVGKYSWGSMFPDEEA